MKKFVNLRKVGKFYNTYESDAYVLHALMGYEVSNGRVGFPLNALGKVQNELEQHKVNYKIIEKEIEVEKRDFKNFNSYEKYFQEGTHSFQKKKDEQELLEKIRSLHPDQVEKILNVIEEMLDAS